MDLYEASRPHIPHPDTLSLTCDTISLPGEPACPAQDPARASRGEHSTPLLAQDSGLCLLAQDSGLCLSLRPDTGPRLCLLVRVLSSLVPVTRPLSESLFPVRVTRPLSESLVPCPSHSSLVRVTRPSSESLVPCPSPLPQGACPTRQNARVKGTPPSESKLPPSVRVQATSLRPRLQGQ
jgi:hypothetical protein